MSKTWLITGCSEGGIGAGIAKAVLARGYNAVVTARSTDKVRAIVEKYPDFIEYIATIADEFRTIKDLHNNGKPYTLGIKVAVLHSWGSLRSWTLSGHFH